MVTVWARRHEIGRPESSPSSPQAAAAGVLAPRLALLALGTLLLVGSLTVWMVTGGPVRLPAALAMTSSFALGIAALVAAATIRAPLAVPTVRRRALAYRLATWLLAVVLGLAVLATSWIAGDLLLHAPLDPSIYVSDAAAFNHYDAELVIRGENPYTADALFWDALRRFPSAAATPLRRGRYATSVWGPSLDDLRHDVLQEIADPARRGPEFAPASLHSYPALAFLVDTPLVWAGLPSTLPLLLAALMMFLVIVGRELPRRQQVMGWMVLLANGIGVVLTLRGSFEVVALLLALLAWQVMPRRVLSPVLLGLACAVKQLVWPLAPLYLVLSVRREGWRGAAARGGILLCAFLAPNLPFVLAAPAAWANSLVLPMSLPLFPAGVGLVALARGGALPLWPQPIYTHLEAAVFVGFIGWFAFRRPVPRPELALLLGLLPFALAWRSLVSYFALLPALALYAALPLLQRDIGALAPASLTARDTATSDRVEQEKIGANGSPERRFLPLWLAVRTYTRHSIPLRGLANPGTLGPLMASHSLRRLRSAQRAITLWLARADVRTALAVTLGLRVGTTLAAAAVPLALPDIYPWRSLLGSDHFTVVALSPSGPHARYSLLDYVLLPWNRWDTVWYTDIAQHGYRTYGSTAFMPLYPLLIRIVAPLLGGNLLASALLLATTATFFALLALYRLAERLAPGRGLGPQALMVAALLPLAFFLVAGYTESLFLALSLWAILAALGERWVWMALLAGLAALTRQQGVLLAILAVPAGWRGLRAMWQRITGAPGSSGTSPSSPLALVAVAAPALTYGGWLGALRLVLHAPSPWQVLASTRGWDQRFAWPGTGLIADAVWLTHPPDAIVNGTELDLLMAIVAAALLLIGLRRLPTTLWLYLTALWCAALVKVLSDGQTNSAGRYMLALLPLCVLPAGWLARGGRPRRIAWVVTGMLTALVCLWTFVLWGWVG
jgi:hypothetical protein